MTVVYVETSAVLTWLLCQARGADVKEVIDSAEQVVTSILTLLEANRSIIRAEALNSLTTGQSQRLRGTLLNHSADWECLEINATVLTRASNRFPIEPIRSLDAIHLASALEFISIYPDLGMLTLDDRVIENLAPLGLPSAFAHE